MEEPFSRLGSFKLVLSLMKVLKWKDEIFMTTQLYFM